MMHQHDLCDVLVVGDLLRQLRRTNEDLAASHRQVDRLAAMILEASAARTRWLTQRHMMERLQEEVNRAERYETPLSVVLGATRGTRPEPDDFAAPQVLQEWIAEGIMQNKRRTDIAGQYGPDGFMILLPQTSANGAATFCRRLKRTLEELQAPGESTIRLDLGAASRSSTQGTAKSLLRCAEEQWQLDRERMHV